jgi:carboxypeptidase Taq
MGAEERAYLELLEKAKQLALLSSAAAIIHWDMETKMPPKAIGLRSQQMALLRQTAHRMITHPRIGELLEKVEEATSLAEMEKAAQRNIYLIRKAYNESTALPEELVKETARQGAITTDAWKKAKAKKDYNRLKPHLEKLLQLKKEAASILMEVKDTRTSYDALLDIYEPGITQTKVSRVFDEMRKGLIKVMERAQSQEEPDTSILNRRIPIEAQRRIARALAEFIQYDMDAGRIDETEHPFTTGYYDDVRITTHYHEDNYTSSIFSTLHEGGHALYEQGLPRKWLYQPVGSAASTGVHEAMSRFVENIVGRSPEFWSHFLPILKKHAKGALDDVGHGRFVGAVNRVKPSHIRIEADEVTYGLHIIIRFEMERGIFAEEIDVDELPRVWNDKYQKYLGLTVPDDSVGVMQDIHWSSGLYGYFPGYALGNIYGGQILQALEKTKADWRHEIAAGSFSQVKDWLTRNVYSYGDIYDSMELIEKITGESLNVDHYVAYLDEKFKAIYGY